MFHGVVAAFVVAIKQLMPEHEVRLMGVIRFRLKVPPGNPLPLMHFHHAR